MEPGTKVRMTEACRQELIRSGCREHADEFFGCIGTVEGPVDFGTSEGPEVEVRWQPSKLRYGYHPTHLEVVDI